MSIYLCSVHVIAVNNWNSDAVASCCGQFGNAPENQPVFRDRFICGGNEENLTECSRRVDYECGHSQDVAVICS